MADVPRGIATAVVPPDPASVPHEYPAGRQHVHVPGAVLRSTDFPVPPITDHRESVTVDILRYLGSPGVGGVMRIGVERCRRTRDGGQRLGGRWSISGVTNDRWVVLPPVGGWVPEQRTAGPLG